MKHIAIIGAGSWGTALGLVAARGNHPVKLWSRSAATVTAINTNRRHPHHLSDVELHTKITASCDLDEALRAAEIIVLAVPSHTIRATLEAMRAFVQSDALIVGATKGIEIETGETISKIVTHLFDEITANRFVCLSGPSFAREVALNQPTAIVAASANGSAAQIVQQVFSSGNFRVYTNDDVTGVELGGAAKNTIALAAGMISGLGLGSNSIAALITRGLAEMTRLAMAHGARRETLTGLAGLGDLVLTCTGELSRNRFVGRELGRGRTLAEVLANMNEVAEGVRTTRAIKRIADAGKIEMPITSEIDAVLYDGKKVDDAVRELMRRPLRDELRGERGA